MPDRLNSSGPSGGREGPDPIIVDERGTARLGPTPERLARAKAEGADAVAEIVTEVPDRNRDVIRRAATVRLMNEDPLNLLYSRKAITREQYACGMQYHHHFMKSGLASGVPDVTQPKVDGGQHKREQDERVWHLGKMIGLDRALGDVHARVLRACINGAKSLEDYGLERGPYRNEKQARDWAQTCFVNALQQLEIIMIGAPWERAQGAYTAPDGRAGVPDGAAALRTVEQRLKRSKSP